MDTEDQIIIPHLWFDREAQEAADFYVSIFPESQVRYVTGIPNTPTGEAQQIDFELWGQRFMAINGGPEFKFNPSISFMVNFDPSRMPDADTRLDEMWAKLAEEGSPLMPLDEYSFSKKYGWIQDRYGVNWQLMLTDPAGEPRPAIIPSLLFVGEKCGRAEEAIRFYTSVFRQAEQGRTVKYPEGSEPEKPGTVMFADFRLENLWLMAQDSALDHAFDFNEAVSLMVLCGTQEEIDYYWEKLSAVPEAEACGWLKDPFGLSWQIVPRAMDDLLTRGTPEQVMRVTEAFLQMKKLDLAALLTAASIT